MRHHLSTCFLYPSPHCYADGYFYAPVLYELLAYPSQYTDSYIPDNLKEIAERVKTGKVNNTIVRYKIKEIN